MVGWRGFEPRTSGLKVPCQYPEFALKTALLPLTCSTWNARKTSSFRPALRDLPPRLIGRHGSMYAVQFRHRGKPVLRYINERQFAELSITSHGGNNGSNVPVASAGLKEQPRTGARKNA